MFEVSCAEYIASTILRQRKNIYTLKISTLCKISNTYLNSYHHHLRNSQVHHFLLTSSSSLTHFELYYTLKMKSFGITAVILTLAASAVAKNCVGGLAYCASTLLSKGRIAQNHHLESN